jgi:hypothetical protein
MMSPMARMFLAAAALVTACGNESPGTAAVAAEEVFGTYRVERDFGSRCAIDQPVRQPADKLELAPMMNGVSLRSCRGAESAEVCGPVRLLPEEIASGWRGTEAFAQTYENGRICVLSYREVLARVESGRLTVEINSHGAQFGVRSCTTADALAEGPSLSCTAHELAEATHTP